MKRGVKRRSDCRERRCGEREEAIKGRDGDSGERKKEGCCSQYNL